MTTMVWINVLLAIPFIALWAGIPLWLVLRRPDARPRLTIFNFEGYRRGVRSRPGLARKPSRRPGRYCICRSRVLTSAVS